MIVVTGAAGRLGKRVAQRLTDEGFQLNRLIVSRYHFAPKLSF